MKTLVSVISARLQPQAYRSNLAALLRLFSVLTGLIVAYSVIFHMLMEREGQQHSWMTGFYLFVVVIHFSFYSHFY